MVVAFSGVARARASVLGGGALERTSGSVQGRFEALGEPQRMALAVQMRKANRPFGNLTFD